MNPSSDTLSQSQVGYLIKTIIVGDSGVGKSSILRNFTQDEFSNNYNATIGLEFESKDVNIQCEEDGSNQKITLQIWDTVKNPLDQLQNLFIETLQLYFQYMMLLINKHFYVKNRKTSFDRLKDWILEIRENSHNDVIIVLIGNKKDDEYQHVTVSESQAEQFINEEGLSKQFFTSAKTGYNVANTFEYIASQVYKRFIKDKQEYRNGVRSSSRSISMDNNKARLIQEQIDEYEANKPTPQHRYSYKNQGLGNSINRGQSLKDQLLDKQDGKTPEKKKCAC